MCRFSDLLLDLINRCRFQQNSRADFRRVCEAYAVLGDRQRRAVYAQYGRSGLSEGVPGIYAGGWRFAVASAAAAPSASAAADALAKEAAVDEACERVFEQFFGTDNPFADVDYDKFRALRELASPAPAPPAVEAHDLTLPLRDVYNGVTTVRAAACSRFALFRHR